MVGRARLTIPLLDSRVRSIARARFSEFEATEARLLRAAVAAFLDLLNLATRTLETFGPAPVA